MSKSYILKIISALILILSGTLELRAQDRSFHSINDAIRYHIRQLKMGNWNNLKHIYVSMKADSIIAEDKVLTIENDMKTDFLKRKETSLLIIVTINSQSNKFKVDISNFNVQKRAKNLLHLTNLGTGGTYLIE